MTDAAAPEGAAPPPAPPPPAEPAPVPDTPRRELIVGGVIILLFFGIFLGWAALAPLDAGAYAQGQVAVSGNRQAVQHRDGGVVSALLVADLGTPGVLEVDATTPGRSVDAPYLVRSWFVWKRVAPTY